MFDGITTFDDYDFTGKTVLMRIDLNTPLNPKTMEFLGDRRFLLHKDTILELIEKNVKLVLLTHQGRPGEPDFTTLEKHAVRLSEIVNQEIRYIDSLFSSYVGRSIKSMENGDIVMLENTRFHSEEILKRPPDVQAKTIFVEKLAPLFDVFVLDGFSVSHRSQPSVVGFPMLMPAVAGRLLEKEVTTIQDAVKNPKPPVTFVLGGTKADDSIKVAKKALRKSSCKILTGGVVGNIFLAAKGYRLGEPNYEFIRGKGLDDQIEVAKKLIDRYGDRILTPLDVALDRGGKREEIPVGDLPQNFRIVDVGKKTVEEYTRIIKGSGTIFANGALGVFEDEIFAYGTRMIIKAIADSEGFSIIGGGHTVAAARQVNVGDKIDHISSGGKASITLMAGETLPGIEALRKVK